MHVTRTVKSKLKLQCLHNIMMVKLREKKQHNL